ncbi:ABC transporter substrate binding protein [Elioraea sp.]|uniref:ABC transporter substrate binding protein n=1 Tax=Elioraea sp. TaxID=2185103 RepID=UPI0025BB8B8F|nr:ABC transporter substrate binding protein [Elioraea sp.]
MIARRSVLALPALAYAPAAAAAPRRLGALLLTGRADVLLRTHLLPELARRGWREGANLTLDAHVAAAPDQPRAAAALVATAPDIIVAVGAPAVRAARAATDAIPIVMHGADARLLAGTSMARPGGNATGVVANTPEAEGKRLEMVAELTPPGTPVAALFHSGTDQLSPRLAAMEAAARQAGRAFVAQQWEGTEGAAPALASLAAQGVRGVALGGTPESLRDARRIAAAARAMRLATIGQWRSMVDEGCTASHGPDFHALYARVAHFVALILRGTQPGELPIEAPMRVETVIDLRAAAALGLAVPVALLARADEVIE